MIVLWIVFFSLNRFASYNKESEALAAVITEKSAKAFGFKCGTIVARPAVWISYYGAPDGETYLRPDACVFVELNIVKVPESQRFEEKSTMVSP